MNRPDQACDEAAPAPDFAGARSQKRRLLAELRASWRDGRGQRPEDLIGQWPGNPENDPDVASLLLEDYCQRGRAGQQPDSLDYSSQFPNHRDALSALSRQQGVFRSLGGGEPGSGFFLSLPEVGDEVFGFQICQELGRGSFARVFLAMQKGLADRPVVLKVSAIDGDEPQTLAQLQHTHIVPIYSVHEDTSAGLRAVCMPYFGGASLSRVLEVIWSKTTRPVRGDEIARTLQTLCAARTFEYARTAGMAGTEPSELLKRQLHAASALPRSYLEKSPLARLAELSYVRAAAWIAACLAEALQHAHDRGVLHRDIKPSNVLLGDDGQPMLLDFNLSQSLAASNVQALATLGGTVAYMAPEHLRALAGRDPILVRQVDQRADIYGLGMVFYEMLTGRRPFEQSASYSPLPALIEAMALERGRAFPSLRERRPDIPWSLESIARKALAPDPEQRYTSAAQLAEDLHRFLEDRPLKCAPELSWAERCAKWVRRHPRLATTGSMALAATVLLALSGVGLVTLQARLKASEGRALRAAGAEAQVVKLDFLKATERARILVNTTTDAPGQLTEGLQLCEQALAVYGVLERPDWQRHAAWQRLDQAEQLALASDVRELLLLLSGGRARQANDTFEIRQGLRAAALWQPVLPSIPVLLSTTGVTALLNAPDQGDIAADLQALHEEFRAALLLLERAEGIAELPPSPALWQDRAAYLRQLGQTRESDQALARAQALPPTDSRDHYLLALSHVRKRQLDSAINELKQALEQCPGNYWSLFLRGICYTQQGQYALAHGDFSACVHLWPEFAWTYFNRGIVLQHLGQTSEALENYNAALARDPRLIDAHLNRGLLLLEQQRPAEALADFDAVVQAGRDDVGLHASRGVALEALGKAEGADVAFASAWKRDPNHVESLLAYGFAISARRPEDAQQAFVRVLDQEPRNARAWYGRGLLLARRDRRSPNALACFSLALQADTGFVAARCGRANVLAHRGEWEQARQDIEWCLGGHPSGSTWYAAACVYALMSQGYRGDLGQTLADHAVQLLRLAFEHGYGQDHAGQDGDLDGLRNNPKFQQLLGPPQVSSGNL
jgi:serine/threonine protein kinase/tetratricopeptide (TPR) repeat protein